MAAAALVTENFKFVSLFFKSKDVMMFNGLIALGTVAGQTVYNVFAFDCPCSPGRNYLYGFAAIGVPALVFFLVGIMFNKNTWDMVSECRLRRCRKLSAAAVFALIGSVFGRALVAPLTWVVISLLQGQAYTCALSEFLNSSAIGNLPADLSSEDLAKLPCEDIPATMKNVKTEIQRQLKYESQVLTVDFSPSSFFADQSATRSAGRELSESNWSCNVMKMWPKASQVALVQLAPPQTTCSAVSA